MSINNQSLRNSNVPQAVRRLEEVGDRVQLKIQRASKSKPLFYIVIITRLV